MVLLRNNFNGGPDGTTLTVGNSGQYGDDAFDNVNNVGTGNTIKFVTAIDRPTAEYMLMMDTGPQNVTPNCGWWVPLGVQTEIWARVYLQFSAITVDTGNNALNLMSFFNVSDATKGVSIGLNTQISPSYLYVANNNTDVITYVTGVQPTTNVWTRLEFHALLGTTNGVADLYLYDGAAADTEVYTDMVSITGQNFGTMTGDIVTLGQGTGSKKNMDPVYFSNWEVNTTGYPGPAPFRPGKGVPGILTNPISIHTSVA